MFVSYAREDEKFVRNLVEKLDKLGYEARYDINVLRHGNDLPQGLADAINQADILIAVLSDASLRSDWVFREMVFAEDSSKPIIPIERTANLQLSDRFRLRFGNLLRLTMADPRARSAELALRRTLAGEPTPPVGSRLWPKLVAASTAVVALIVAAVVLWPSAPETWAMQNIEFVVDTSGSSNAEFEAEGGRITRFQAMTEALREKVDRKDGAALALRTFGGDTTGPCSGTDLRVEFRAGNGADIVAASQEIPRGGGRANLFEAVDLALQDLQVPVSELPSPTATRKVIVFVASEDVCDDGAETLQRQIDELATDGVKLELRLVGLGLDSEAAKAIGETFDDVCDVNCNSQFVNAVDTSELEDVLTDWVEIEPLLDLRQALTDLNNTAVAAANEAVAAANGYEVDEYLIGVAGARTAFEGSAPAYASLDLRIELPGAESASIEGLVAASRETFGLWIASMEQLEGPIRGRAADNEDEDARASWNQAVDATNAALRASNSARNDLFAAIDDLIDQLRS